MKARTIANYLKNSWLALILIALVAVSIYSNIYRGPFVFDGVMHIEDKVKIRDLKRWFSSALPPRPLVELTFALNYKLGKLHVFGYHLVNVFIHIINGFLAYFLALNIMRQLSFSLDYKKNGAQKGLSVNSQSPITNHQSSIPLMSLFAALIFVAHPIQTQAVTYTVQRYTSMAAMFYFLSIFLYMRARILQQGAWEGRQRTKGRGRRAEDGGKGTGGGAGISWKNVYGFKVLAYFALCFVSGILAYFSKPSAASLPGAILLLEFLLFDRTWRGWLRKLLWITPLFVFMGVFILYIAGKFSGGVQFGKLLEDVSEILRAPGTVVSRWDYLCTQFNVVVIYIRLLFFPVGQNLDYLYPFNTGFFEGYTPLAALFLIAIIGVGIWSVKKRPVITFGIFWFFITVSVESGIFPIKDALFEHRLYLPMFGFAIVVAYSVFYLLPVKRYWAIVISILIILSFGTATYFRNRVWQNGTTLWLDVVSKSPHNYRAHYNLGTILYHNGEMDKAIKSYSDALRIQPDFAIAHDNLGVALVHKGKQDDAMKHFSQALRIRPKDPKILTNYGQALMQQGKIQDAIAHFLRALEIDSDNSEARNNLGIALARQGKLKEAIQHFSEALEIEPHNAKIHSNLGQAFMLQGKLRKAARNFSEAVRLNPEYAEAHSKLGIVLTRLGDYHGAIGHFSKALQIRPGLREARIGLKRAVRLRRMKKRL